MARDPELHFQPVHVILAVCTGLLLTRNPTFYDFSIYHLTRLVTPVTLKDEITRNDVGLTVPTTTVEMAPLFHYTILLTDIDL